MLLRQHSVQDGFILAALLGSRLTTRKTVAVALEVYDTIRRPVVQETGQRTIEFGQSLFLERPWSTLHEHLATADDAEACRFEESGPVEAFEQAVEDLYGWLWYGSALEYRSQALEKLHSKIPA